MIGRLEIQTRPTDIEERIRSLEIENEALSARAEDLLLLGLIGEQIQSLADPTEIVRLVLERMALLKDVPFCCCATRTGDELTLFAHYCSFTNSKIREDRIELAPSFAETLDVEGRQILRDEDISLRIEFSDDGMSFEPSTLLLIPFASRFPARGFFVFADARAPCSLEESAEMLHRIVDLLVTRLDHIALLAELRELNAELDARVERRTAELRQAQKMESIGRLAGGVAHDFNNLLSTIVGYSELALLELPEDHSLSENLKLILEAGDRAADLTRQLLAFSRKQVLQIEILQLEEVVEEVAKMLRRIIGEDVELRLRLRPTRSIAADRGQLEQVLLNLAVNARDAMPSGGRLLIQTQDVELREQDSEELAAGPHVALICTDTGVGMSKQIAEQIFEPFFTTKAPGKGTGLGLATSYGIVRQHGGTIDVESETGSGTSFRVLLPAIEAEAARVEAAQIEASMPRGSETVLVVDDDGTIRALVQRILSPLGYRVIEAKDGGEALAKMAELESAVDLLLSDVIMPGLGGRELVSKVIGLHPQTAIVLMTGYPEDHEALARITKDGIVLLHKPILPSKLATQVRSILDRVS